MPIELHLNNVKSNLTLDGLPESLEKFKIILINLFDWPRVIGPYQISLKFSDEDGEKLNLDTEQDFEVLREEPNQVVFIEVDEKLLKLANEDLAFAPIIIDDAPISIKDLEPVVQKLLNEKIQEIIPELATKLDDFYRKKYSEYYKKIYEQKLAEFAEEKKSNLKEETPKKATESETQTDGLRARTMVSEAQTDYVGKECHGVQFGVFLNGMLNSEIQTDPKQQLIKEVQTKRIESKEMAIQNVRKMADSNSQTLQNVRKMVDSNSQTQSESDQFRIEFLRAEFLQKRIRVSDPEIILSVAIQNKGDQVIKKGKVGIRIAEKFCLLGERKILDGFQPKELKEMTYKITNPKASGAYGGFLEIYNLENGAILNSTKFEFQIEEVSEDLFPNVSQEIKLKIAAVLEFLELVNGDANEKKKIMEYFTKNPEANIDQAVNWYYDQL